jgi:hypothetical protein
MEYGVRISVIRTVDAMTQVRNAVKAPLGALVIPWLLKKNENTEGIVK